MKTGRGQGFVYYVLQKIIKNIEFCLKWSNIDPHNTRINIQGYFDMLITILIVLDRQSRAFK